MEVRCPKCAKTVSFPNGTTSGICPGCQTPLSVKPVDNKALVAGLLAEARKIEMTTPGPQPLLSAEAAAQRAKERGGRERAPDEPNWGYRFAIIGGIVGFLLVGALVYYLVDTSNRNDAASKCLREIEPEIAPLRTHLQVGYTAREAKEYVKAAESFKKVADRAGVLLLRLRDEASVARDSALIKRTGDLTREAAELAQKSEKALAAPDVKYGAQGMVEYEGEWVASEEKEKRFKARMTAEGKQLYKGEWLTEAEIHERNGEVLYQGRWIPKAERDRLEAAAAAAALAAATAPPATPTTTQTRRQRPPPPKITPANFDPAAGTWMIDDFETASIYWSNETWGNINPVAIETEKYNDVNAMALTFKGGKNDKSVIVRPMGVSFANRAKLTIDLVNQTTGSVKVAIGMDTDKYYESRWVPLKPGINKAVTFDLKAGDYKSAATNWSPATKIGKIDNVSRLFLLFYTDPNLTDKVYIQNIKALGGG